MNIFKKIGFGGRRKKNNKRSKKGRKNRGPIKDKREIFRTQQYQSFGSSRLSERSLLNDTYEVDSAVESDYFSLAAYESTVWPSDIESERTKEIGVDKNDAYESASDSSNETTEVEDNVVKIDRIRSDLKKSSSGGTSVTYDSSDSREFCMSSVTDDGSIIRRFSKLTTHEEEEEEYSDSDFHYAGDRRQQMTASKVRFANISPKRSINAGKTMMLYPKNVVVGNISTTAFKDIDSDSDDDSIYDTHRSRRKSRKNDKQEEKERKKEHNGSKKKNLSRTTRSRRRKQTILAQYNVRNQCIPANTSTIDNGSSDSNKVDLFAKTKCVVCMKRERTHVALPCMHYSFCETCAFKLSQRTHYNGCPVCDEHCITFTELRY